MRYIRVYRKRGMGIFMEQKSRTQYSAYNTTVGLVSRLMSIIMGYIVRIVFTRMLSENYVGVNGLFTDILNVLSLSEMGIETAISFALYKPIAENDIEKQKSIMNIYKWFYRFVAAFVLGAGLLVIPFMDVLIKNKPDIDNLTYIYILYLINSAASYLLIYKKTLLDAHQLKYIGVVAKTGSWIIQDIFQIAVLILTKNFILYLYIYIAATVLSNIYISRKTDKLYPYVKEKDIKPLDRESRNSIIKNVKAMMMHQVGNVIVNNTDNLLISAFVGIVSVGKYSNYYLLIGSIRQVMSDAVDGITASVGNLGVTEDASRVRKIFNAAALFNHWAFGFAAVCLFELLNPFVELSFGEKYLFEMNVVFILCVNFYIYGITKTSKIFHNSLGLFWYDRYKAIIEAAINLVVSLLMVRSLGVFGIFLGTFVSTFMTTLWVEPYVIYKYHFKEPVYPYYLNMFFYFVQTAAAWGAAHFLCVEAQHILGITVTISLMALRLVIVTVTVNIIYIIFNIRSENFGFLWGKFIRLVKDRKQSRNGEVK